MKWDENRICPTLWNMTETAMSENQVIYNCGGHRVVSPLRGSAHYAVDPWHGDFTGSIHDPPAHS